MVRLGQVRLGQRGRAGDGLVSVGPSLHGWTENRQKKGGGFKRGLKNQLPVQKNQWVTEENK